MGDTEAAGAWAYFWRGEVIMATVELRNIWKRFGSVEVIKGINLVIPDREFVALLGPSGCGKSTLLRMIAGLEEPSEGDILIDRVRVNDIQPDRRGLAMVFQSYALYPHMTVSDNMGFALKLAKVAVGERVSKIQGAARTLQIDRLLDRKPRQLSGGQRQRIAIGRAIVRDPKVFLFDEPLSNLDAALRAQMRVELANMHQRLRATMIFVTHDQTEAMTLASRVVVLNRGEVEQVGTPLELYFQPRNIFVATFIGSPQMNLLAGEVVSTEEGRATVQIGQLAAIDLPFAGAQILRGDKVTVGIRPETFALDANGVIPGRIKLIEHLGVETILYVEIDSEQLVTVRGPGDQIAQVGDSVRLAIANTRRVLVFNEEGFACAPSTQNAQSHM
jgi:multiple sugar transport system ATP-binding protein